MIQELAPELVHELYAWIDAVPLNRPKRNISRDFSDGVACAEVIKHYLPKFVELHNYSPANGISQKMYNWNTLIAKVTKKFNYIPSDELIAGIVNNRVGYIEVLLWEMKEKLTEYLMKKGPLPPELNFTFKNGAQPQQQMYQQNPQQQPYFSAGANLPHSQSFVSSAGANPYMPALSPNAAPQYFGDYPPNFVQQQAPQQGGDKDQIIQELQETIGILQLKIDKLEQLLTLKTKHIDELEAALAAKSGK